MGNERIWLNLQNIPMKIVTQSAFLRYNHYIIKCRETNISQNNQRVMGVFVHYVVIKLYFSIGRKIR